MPTFSFFGYTEAALQYDPATGAFSLSSDYSPSTGRVRFEITDDDASLDGDRSRDERGEDSSQTGIAETPSGAQIATGQIYGEQTFNVQAPDGSIISLDLFEIGGQMLGYVPSELLEPGVNYTYVGGQNIDNNLGSRGDTRSTYDDYVSRSVPCFGPGSRIETPKGPRDVSQLEPGDLVLTRDHGPQPVLWVDRSMFLPTHWRHDPGARPMVVSSEPADLILSGNHRVLVADPRLDMLFGSAEVFIMAKDLTRIGQARPYGRAVRMQYTHLLFERHEIIRANGFWVESLLATPSTLAAMPAVVRAHVADVLGSNRPRLRAARACLRRHEVAVFADALGEMGLAA